jgi:outer membrane lipoprotein carrier protein
MRSVLIILLCCISVSAHAASASAELDQFLQGLTSFTADFRQRLLDEDKRLVETSEGQLFVKRPGSFRWNYTHPYPQEIVGARNHVWVYDSELEQVSVKAIDDALGNSPALLLTTTRPLAELFAIKDLGEKNGINWVELRPLKEDAAFNAFNIGMVRGSLQVMELKDNFGQLTQLSFGKLVRNPELDDKLFEFVPPAGADVVGDVPPKASSN